MKELKLQQLSQTFSQEKEEEELKQRQLREYREQDQKHRKQMVEAEIETAKLEATLRKAADSSLEWDRKDDFADEKAMKTVDSTEKTKEKQRCKSEEKRVDSALTRGEPAMTHDNISKSLPRLSLCTFSGDPCDWPSWYGLFTALVHNRKALTTTEKMMYLQSSVGGMARQLISGMLCDPNLYEEALQTLEECGTFWRLAFAPRSTAALFSVGTDTEDRLHRAANLRPVGYDALHAPPAVPAAVCGACD